MIGSVAKRLCCPLREEGTSAALSYTRRAGFWAVPGSTRPVEPRAPSPPAPSPQPPPKELYSRKVAFSRRISLSYSLCVLQKQSLLRQQYAGQRASVMEQRSSTVVGSNWPEMPLRHAPNPCGLFSLCASANCCVPGPPRRGHHSLLQGCLSLSSWPSPPAPNVCF